MRRDPPSIQWQHGQFGRAGGSTKRQPGLDLEPHACSRWQRANGADAAAADEVRLAPAWIARRGDEAELHPAQPLQPAEALDDVLERLHAIAQPGCLLVAEALGQVREAVLVTTKSSPRRLR